MSLLFVYRAILAVDRDDVVFRHLGSELWEGLSLSLSANDVKFPEKRNSRIEIKIPPSDTGLRGHLVGMHIYMLCIHIHTHTRT